jgi:hypothetical protein
LFGYTVDTLYNIGSVARRVPVSLRSEVLSFRHHQFVARLHDDPAAQRKWLAEAVEHGWTCYELDAAMCPHRDEQYAAAIARNEKARAVKAEDRLRSRSSACSANRRKPSV